MSIESERERDLEQQFLAERAEDARHAPPFANVLTRPSVASPRHRLLPAMALGTAVLAAVALWQFRPSTDAAFALTPGEMRVPTDYLLDLASFPRAGEVPRIGVVNWFPLEPSADNRRQQ